MSGNCGVCNLMCDGESIKCSGSCEKIFHITCTNVSSDFLKTRNARKEWRCEHCKRGKSNTPTVSEKSSGAEVLEFKEFIKNALEDFKKEVLSELQSNAKQFEEFKTSLNFFSSKLDEANKAMNDINKNCNTLKKENDELKKKNAELTNDVKMLKIKMKNLEQYSRKNNVEVSGVPASNGENVKQLVKDIGAAINVVVREEDVMAAHRVPTYNREKAPSLIIQLHNRTLRDNWLKGFKDLKNLTANKINNSFPQSRVYVSEHLTPDNKMLLRITKQKCKEVGYQYSWVKEGKIYVRRASQEKSIKIEDYDDLAKLV